MHVTHTTTIHTICPHEGWDYYSVTYYPREFFSCEDFQGVCDDVRGLTMYQEDITRLIADKLPEGKVVVTGMHGANTETVCAMECS